MKKLLSLSLAIVMMLSCVLCQAVVVSAAETVSSTNAPYAGVYQVTSDKAVTLTNETGHTVSLAAGATDYFYLIKGNNNITSTDASANVTFTTLANNGMDYIANVTTSKDLHTTATTYFGPVGEGSYIGDYYVGSENGSCTAGSTSIVIPEGATAILSGSLKGTAGMYYVTLSMEKVNGGIVKVETDTGFYTEHIPTGAGWATFGPASGSDLEAIYLRDGVNTLKVTNIGSGSITLAGVKMARTNNVAAYESQLNFASFKVIPYVEQTPGVPVPTEAPTVSGVVVYSDAPYAGVYEVTADKAVTLTNETGHKVTLAADETGYFYLIKGSNKINYSDVTATVSFTALENNGLDYLAEVAIDEVPLAANRYYIGRASDGQNIGSFVISKDDSVVNNTSDVSIPAGASVVINVPVPADNAGIYSFGIYTTASASSVVKFETDTGYYGELLLDGASFTEISVDNLGSNDLEQAYLREGDNYVTFTNNGSEPIALSYLRIYKTAQLASMADYNWQLNYNYFKVVVEGADVVDSFINDVDAIVSGSEITLIGRVGAEWMEELYGVEFSSNKEGTRAQKYYGAKSGDTVAADENATSTTTFTFGEWDGSFEIILKGVSAGEKEYRFFVGADYSETATLIVE